MYEKLSVKTYFENSAFPLREIIFKRYWIQNLLGSILQISVADCSCNELSSKPG